MHLYLRAAVSVPPAARQPTRRVAFEAGAAAPVRMPKPGKRQPFQIAPAEASAFCLPETAPARAAGKGSVEEHERAPAEAGVSYLPETTPSRAAEPGSVGESERAPAVPTPPSAGQAGGRETSEEAQGAPKSTRAQRRFVVLFAGRERPYSLRDALQRLGARVDTYELLDGPEQDLSKPSVQS